MIILCVVVVCLILRTRVKQPIEENEGTNSEENNSVVEVNEIYINQEVLENDNSTYTALQRPAPGEPSDVHAYAHLMKH